MNYVKVMNTKKKYWDTIVQILFGFELFAILSLFFGTISLILLCWMVADIENEVSIIGKSLGVFGLLLIIFLFVVISGPEVLVELFRSSKGIASSITTFEVEYQRSILFVLAIIIVILLPLFLFFFQRFQSEMTALWRGTT